MDHTCRCCSDVCGDTVQVVGLGIRGVFTILRDVWQSMPELCLKVLREFLNILQGQEPAGLKHEPQDTTSMFLTPF